MDVVATHLAMLRVADAGYEEGELFLGGDFLAHFEGWSEV